MERETVDEILRLMETYQISGTWAIVGHLFLSQCRREDGVKHPEISRPDYSWHPADWYDLDPCSDLKASPTWYGPDLIAGIRESPTHTRLTQSPMQWRTSTAALLLIGDLIAKVATSGVG